MASVPRKCSSNAHHDQEQSEPCSIDDIVCSNLQLRTICRELITFSRNICWIKSGCCGSCWRPLVRCCELTVCCCLLLLMLLLPILLMSDNMFGSGLTPDLTTSAYFRQDSSNFTQQWLGISAILEEFIWIVISGVKYSNAGSGIGPNFSCSRHGTDPVWAVS